MLQELSIKSFAIIDDININFFQGLTIFSGETGAGKSIILNAVNLLLGGRAYSRLVRSGDNSAELEALFKIPEKSLAAKKMEDLGFNYKEGLIIRRIISNTDNNRVYINGRLSTMQMLNSITQNLASISGQHANQSLLKEEQHLFILDEFGDIVQLREKVYKSFHKIQPLLQELDKLKGLKERQAEEINLLEYQKQEILEAKIIPDEDKLLEREKILLKNGEALSLAVHSSIDILYNNSGAVIENLVDVQKRIEKAGATDSNLIKKAEKINEATFLIEDITENLRNYVENIETDETRLEEVEERLNTLNKLKGKYGGSLKAIELYLERIVRKLGDIENITDKIVRIEKDISKLHEKLKIQVKDLSEKRKEKAKLLSKNVEIELASLKMAQTRFNIDIKHTISDTTVSNSSVLTCEGKEITEKGIDNVRFLISPNIGEELKPLSAVASGGELSRVVLALKAILAVTDSVETIIFDEVDAGVGGGTAEVIGKKLEQLSNNYQVICITHLPQIARFGDYHFRILKNVTNNRTFTKIDAISDKERINELARMLGGENITEATLAHAREMINHK